MENYKILQEITGCRNCHLCSNQLPIIDKKEQCDVMWVGLSAKKVNNLETSYPLKDDTNSCKILKEVEDILPNIKYYKTNLVKCLPLDEKGKIRYPNTEEMNTCINNLISEIQFLKPKIVFLLGNNVSNFVEKYIQKNNINLDVYFKKIEHPSYIYVYKRKNKQEYINRLTNYIDNVFEN